MQTVAIIGAGAMGGGIAQVAAAAGHPVRLYDTRAGAAAAAIATTRRMFEKLAAKGKMTAEAAAAASERLAVAAAWEDLAPAEPAPTGLVIEAVVEDLAVKREIFARLEALVAPDCLLATNTSSLSIPAIASALRAPQRLVGMHFFNPAPLMELVEVVGGIGSDPGSLSQVEALARAWGKTPVRARSTPGFIVNRVARPFYAEGLRLLAEGAATPATLDAVMRECGGFRMGPCELTDLIGQDVNFAVTSTVFRAFFGDPRFAPSLVQQELVEAGWLGRKSGRGFYSYAEGAVTEPPAPVTEPPAPVPERVTLGGTGPLVEALLHRLAGSSVRIAREAADQQWVEAGDAVIAPSDGRTAAERARQSGPRDLVLVDLALDYERATRVAVARAPRCSDAAYHSAVGLLQAAGFAVSPLRDLPGLAVLRTVAMLANEAADAVHYGVASAADVDTAMRKGVNYPLGPLAWADRLGVANLHTALAHLAAFYGEDRYRTSPLIHHLRDSGGRFHG